MSFLLAGFPGMDILLAVKNGVLLGKQRSPGAIHLKALETLTVCQRSPCLTTHCSISLNQIIQLLSYS